MHYIIGKGCQLNVRKTYDRKVVSANPKEEYKFQIHLKKYFDLA